MKLKKPETTNIQAKILPKGSKHSTILKNSSIFT